MERASRVMYTIANIFNWISAISYAVLIIFSILGLVKVVDIPADLESIVGSVGWLVYYIIAFIVCLLKSALYRQFLI